LISRILTGWGRVSPSRADVTGPLELDRLCELVASRPAGGVLARGAGRSYGDAAQNAEGCVLAPVTKPSIELDVLGASVLVTAATTFTELLAGTIPHGLLPPVLPGTRHLTIGGAVAADVHGKNQHADGSISDWIDEITLIGGDGVSRVIQPGTPAFRATVGGMGLTGIIISVRLRLLRIRSARLQVTSTRLGDLDSLLAAQDRAAGGGASGGGGQRYAVAWIDMSATGRSLGRGILDTGEHLPDPDPDGLEYRPGRTRRAPALPFSPFTVATAGVFNRLWYRASASERTSVAGIAAYFHRLDAIADWNRSLGPRGFLQYQFVVPSGADQLIAEVIETLQRHRAAVFLGTLKRFGASNGNYLSFPMPGWSLAADMPAARPGLLPVLAALDDKVAAAGGRVYLAKDARLGPEAFARMYGDLDKWRAARAELDPADIFRSDLGRRLGLVD
jgi:decaprenylphospho-beta-D-ribofuranose 2-oxidase